MAIASPAGVMHPAAPCQPCGQQPQAFYDFQVGAVVTFLAISFIHFIVALPLIGNSTIFAVLVAIEAILTAASAAVYLWTSLIDTSDPAISCNDTSQPLYCDSCQVSAIQVLHKGLVQCSPDSASLPSGNNALSAR